MESSWQRFRQRLKRLEAVTDAWAAKRLTAEEYADAVILDRELKRNFWAYLAALAGATVVGAFVALLVAPGLTFPRALLYSAVVIAYVLGAVASAWYGYRKWAGKPAWRVFGLFMLLIVLGLLTGLWFSTFSSGKSIFELDLLKVQRGLGIVMILGIAASAILIGIANLRSREASHRAARLQADADRERLARQFIQAELKLMQAQVEPHFLFNTLANLRFLVQTNSPDALKMLDHLIKYLRTALPEIRAEGSTLGKEGELARAYLEIMRIRMGGALEFSIEVPEALANHSFPPLILMTLVENAVKHGIAPAGRGRIDVRMSASAQRLRIEVEDNGRGLGTLGRGVGLQNVRDRLLAIFGETARLELASRADVSGTSATIEVPA